MYHARGWDGISLVDVELEVSAPRISLGPVCNFAQSDARRVHDLGPPPLVYTCVRGSVVVKTCFFGLGSLTRLG